MSQPANDDFSQHLSDGEESNHEDASDTGTAPKQQQQVIPQTTAISNIKLPILKKEEYDIWAMEMEHYLEYIDNEVWKVIQNGNSKKRISIGKDGVVRVLSPVTAAEIQAVEKERKAKNILLMAIPKEHMRRFHGMKAVKEKEQLQKTIDSWKDSSKNLWRLINSGMSSNDKLGLGRFTKTNDFKGVPHPLSGDYTPKLQEEIDDSLALTMVKLVLLFLQYLALLQFFNQIPEKEVLAGFANEVIYSLFSKQSEDWDLLHEDLEQIDDLDIDRVNYNWQTSNDCFFE
ncbi:hypothetical protein Tco_0505381 [Tanacetum coccineum]